jgi:tRNA U34 5-methylaminomethyl-2-thiouridine-forming methyltransferase MnmC
VSYDPVAGAVVLTEDGSATLHSPRYRQSYHSTRGALSEARHVFLEGSGVAAMLRSGRPVRLLEVGVGSGLNLLISADLATRCKVGLDYVGLDRELPSVEQLTALDHGRHLHAPDLAAAWRTLRCTLDTRDAPLDRLGTTTVELRLGDARDTPLESGRFHAIYHDAFSPDANPELWSEPFLGRLYAALAPGGHLVSYTVQGELRRRLEALGFEVAKRPGPPGGKREVLSARKPPSGDMGARG